MSWLLFMDESGHDHRNTPYEVRGGIAIHTGQVWPFVRAMQRLEIDAFGVRLSDYRSEIKGHKLLDKDRFKFARQSPLLDADTRRILCREFLKKGVDKRSPTSQEFSAYGQASLEMAKGIFELLRFHGAALFASAIPRGVTKPDNFANDEYLRKDHVFLFERFFYMLEKERKFGLLIMDESEKSEDPRFVKRMEDYFTKTETGRYRTSWIVPSPFFVASDMAYPIQAADVCIYAINWGFRLPRRGMTGEVRQEIADTFSPWIIDLQWKGDIMKDGDVYPGYGIVYVPDPYQSRR